MIFYRYMNFSKCRKEVFNNLQAQFMSLAEGDAFPLCALENILNAEYVALDRAPRELDA